VQGIISTQPKMTSINSCIEVDLTGQICSDSIGSRIYSGFGGQVDFVRGAGECVHAARVALAVPHSPPVTAGACPDGKAIIALPSTTSKGESRIVPYLKQGAGVVTTRAHAHYVVTEYGIASLFGKSIRERARALIDIAHPTHREKLEEMAYHVVHNKV
jgi:acyl-CoA hydrolase